MAAPEGIHFTGGLIAIGELKREEPGLSLTSKTQHRCEGKDAFTASLRDLGN